MCCPGNSALTGLTAGVKESQPTTVWDESDSSAEGAAPEHLHGLEPAVFMLSDHCCKFRATDRMQNHEDTREETEAAVRVKRGVRGRKGRQHVW